MASTTKFYLESTGGDEEEFYVLKFPLKLWRIVNECQTGAIKWGCYGKTILIDYNLFQAEYLECPVPKFKTRNMTSFVRQLNMYGFKKMQTQQRNVMSRYCNIHEFFNENFRFGRPDLLCNVKRRTIPLKMEKITNVFQTRKQQNLSCSELSKKVFEETLMNSPGFFGFWRMTQNMLAAGDGERIIQPTYQILVIPATKIAIDQKSETAVAEILADFDRFILSQPNEDIEEPEESENEDSVEDGLDPAAFEMSIPPVSPQSVWVRPKEDSECFVEELQNYSKLNIKEGFDGTHYILDVTRHLDFEVEQKTENEKIVPDPLEMTSLPLLTAGNCEAENTSAQEVLLHIPESTEENFYTSLANSFTNV